MTIQNIVRGCPRYSEFGGGGGLEIRDKLSSKLKFWERGPGN